MYLIFLEAGFLGLRPLPDGFLIILHFWNPHMWYLSQRSLTPQQKKRPKAVFFCCGVRRSAFTADNGKIKCPPGPKNFPIRMPRKKKMPPGPKNFLLVKSLLTIYGLTIKVKYQYVANIGVARKNKMPPGPKNFPLVKSPFNHIWTHY